MQSAVNHVVLSQPSIIVGVDAQNVNEFSLSDVQIALTVPWDRVDPSVKGSVNFEDKDVVLFELSNLIVENDKVLVITDGVIDSRFIRELNKYSNGLDVEFAGSVTIAPYAFGECKATRVMFRGPVKLNHHGFVMCKCTHVHFFGTVNTVPTACFRDSSALKSVVARNVLDQTVGRSAFANCSMLQTIDMDIKSFDQFACSSCTRLEHVDFKNVNHIGFQAFYASGVRNLRLRAENVRIAGHAFYGSMVDTVYCKHEWKLQGTSNFAYCPKLTSVSVGTGDGVQPLRNMFALSEHCFDNCPNLKRVTLAMLTDTIPRCAFSGTRELTALSIRPSNAVVRIDRSAFHSCISLWNMQWFNRCTHVGADAFYNAKIGMMFVLNTCIHTIANGAFAKCKMLTMRFPPSLTTIGEKAFTFAAIRILHIDHVPASFDEQCFYGAQVRFLIVSPTLSEKDVWKLSKRLRCLKNVYATLCTSEHFLILKTSFGPGCNWVLYSTPQIMETYRAMFEANPSSLTKEYNGIHSSNMLLLSDSIKDPRPSHEIAKDRVTWLRVTK